MATSALCRVLQGRGALLHLLPDMHLQHAPDVCSVPPVGCSVPKHGHCLRNRYHSSLVSECRLRIWAASFGASTVLSPEVQCKLSVCYGKSSSVSKKGCLKGLSRLLAGKSVSDTVQPECLNWSPRRECSLLWQWLMWHVVCAGGVVLLLLIVLSGYAIVRTSVPPWWVPSCLLFSMG